MNGKPLLGLGLLCALACTGASLAQAEHSYADDKWAEEFSSGPCQVKRTADNAEYKEEIKCPNGYGAHWPRGEWKDEYWERDCKVKIEAKHDEYKKEVKCRHDDD